MKKTVQKASKSAAKSAAKKQAPAAAKAAPKAAAKAAPKSAAAVKAAGGRSIEGSLVKQLASILDETALTEIEYEAGGVRVRVARHHGGAAVGAPVAYAAPAAAAAALPAPVAAPAAAPADPATHPGTVKSPMVGMCYLLPEPGAAPFVKVGDNISEGQTLCLIEAMKTFNPVKAPRAGKVVKIIVENGAPVEYGEPLLIIE